MRKGNRVGMIKDRQGKERKRGNPNANVLLIETNNEKSSKQKAKSTLFILRHHRALSPSSRFNQEVQHRKKPYSCSSINRASMREISHF